MSDNITAVPHPNLIVDIGMMLGFFLCKRMWIFKLGFHLFESVLKNTFSLWKIYNNLVFIIAKSTCLEGKKVS